MDRGYQQLGDGFKYSPGHVNTESESLTQSERSIVAEENYFNVFS
jgi:hypothetical protein